MVVDTSFRPPSDSNTHLKFYAQQVEGDKTTKGTPLLNMKLQPFGNSTWITDTDVDRTETINNVCMSIAQHSNIVEIVYQNSTTRPMIFVNALQLSAGDTSRPMLKTQTYLLKMPLVLASMTITVILRLLMMERSRVFII